MKKSIKYLFASLILFSFIFGTAILFRSNTIRADIPPLPPKTFESILVGELGGTHHYDCPPGTFICLEDLE